MGNALPKQSRIHIPARDKSHVAKAKQATGFYDVQLNKALCVAFERYEKALEELAKV